MKTIALLALLLTPAAPAQKAAEPTPTRHGAAFTLPQAVPLDEIAKAPDDHAGKTVQVTGTVASVCRKKGCWMTLKGDTPAATARITFKDYAFFVPKDCDGKRATVEGSLQVKTLTPEERQHFAEDARVDVSQIPEKELRLVATGVELQDAK